MTRREARDSRVSALWSSYSQSVTLHSTDAVDAYTASVPYGRSILFSGLLARAMISTGPGISSAHLNIEACR